MALGQQQNRPVNPNDDFGFNVASYTGAVVTEDTFVAGVALVGTLDVVETIAITDDGANGATYDVTCDGTGGIASLSYVLGDGDAGYSVGDTVTLLLAGFTNATGGSVTAQVVSVDADTVTFDTITGTGTVGFQALDVLQSSELSGGAGTGLVVRVDTVDANGLPTGMTATNVGDGFYETADTVTYSGSGEVGLSDVRYSDHDQYELGGAQNEYPPLPSTDSGLNTGSKPLTYAIDTTDGTRVGDPSTTPETGRRFTDNVSTIKVVTKADEPQWQVQQLDIAGIGQGSATTVTVFAEPGVIDTYGNLVGQDLRAEDITDESRCDANGFVWVSTAPTGDADQGNYGYCRELIATDFDGIAFTATEHADCPDGFQWDGATGCEIIPFADFAAPAGTKLADMDIGELAAECKGAGHFAQINTGNTGSQTFECVAVYDQAGGDTGPATEVLCKAAGDVWAPDGVCYGQLSDNFSFANFNYDTTSSNQKYSETTCKQLGFFWKASDRTCIPYADPAGFATQLLCNDAGHVWIAGQCYDGADFGDGHNRKGSFQQDPNTVPK